jgi:hypothetical protein
VGRRCPQSRQVFRITLHRSHCILLLSQEEALTGPTHLHKRGAISRCRRPTTDNIVSQRMTETQSDDFDEFAGIDEQAKDVQQSITRLQANIEACQRELASLRAQRAHVALFAIANGSTQPRWTGKLSL